MSGKPKERPDLNPSARSSARLGLGEVDVITPGIIHVRMAGAIRPEHMEPLMRVGDEQIAKGYRVLLAIDADDVHGYKTEVRTVFQLWLRQNRNSVEKVWVLFRSPLVKMLIGLINTTTDGMVRSFSDPDEFDTQLSEAISKAKSGWLERSAEVHH
jgi:hypothetical protein